ncbi:hypothetical protein CEXT_627831 [Caerostris extrusa]|uniref:Uncharacterized protein n=1 Tax=Caerostris extrusa TaxID=172846 RepID=A0AAV4XG60_CAEEX|nr:hypothetical protein CEXT_627831 [Caerostris extrusa]
MEILKLKCGKVLSQLSIRRIHAATGVQVGSPRRCLALWQCSFLKDGNTSGTEIWGSTTQRILMTIRAKPGFHGQPFAEDWQVAFAPGSSSVLGGRACSLFPTVWVEWL